MAPSRQPSDVLLGSRNSMLHSYRVTRVCRGRERAPALTRTSRVRITYARANTRRNTARYVYRIVYERYIYTLDGSFVWLFNTFAARFSALRDVQVDTESIFLTYPLFSNDAFFHSFKWKFNGKFNVIEL